jgi:monofunctional biosynthetic peptidoglycan transglycosylase
MDEKQSLKSRPEQGRPFQHITLWVKKNKVISLALLVLFFLVVDLLFLPFSEIEQLRTVNPRETAFMRQYRERLREQGKSVRISHQWVPLNSISQDLINAVIVAEDGTFWQHSGFDWFEFKESIERNVSEGKVVRGASTITQQLVKNLFLTPSKNPLRKLREWVLTWWMEQTLSKARILEIYLNVIEWGEGIYGAEMAARTYFSKSAAELTRGEAARLAAVLPNPNRRRPNSGSLLVERRAEIILSRMAARGL